MSMIKKLHTFSDKIGEHDDPSRKFTKRKSTFKGEFIGWKNELREKIENQKAINEYEAQNNQNKIDDNSNNYQSQEKKFMKFSDNHFQ